MSKVREIHIKHFRGINSLTWRPEPGINCLVGAGDSSKSTVLDAIDWCLGVRRTLPVDDSDFHLMDTERPICIEVTLGSLEEHLKSLESYGQYVRGYDIESGDIYDEPGQGLETVLTVRLVIESDLEAVWRLISARAEAQGISRNLAWKDRIRLAPTRIGMYSMRHFSWQKGALVTKLSDEDANVSAALAVAAREARNSFGDTASGQLGDTLQTVESAADKLGIDYGENLSVLLDPQSVSFSGGTISLHDGRRVPLKRLGLGSSRLLAAGLQREVAPDAPIVLVDELEYGLEPHRIMRLLQALGSKEPDAPVQVFMTTHSPVVLRELKASQLWIIRPSGPHHAIYWAGDDDGVQGTLRRSAEGFLGRRILVCEGATEVGLIRGIDLFRDDRGHPSFFAAGGVAVDAGGIDDLYRRAFTFQKLGYEVAVLRDDDKQPDEADEHTFQRDGGRVYRWADGCATEDAIFNVLPGNAVRALYACAAEIHDEERVHNQLCSACNEGIDLEAWLERLDNDKRRVLATAAKGSGWFKRIEWMETAARQHIGPELGVITGDLSAVIDRIFRWAGADDG